MQTDYTCWSERELIERIEELEAQNAKLKEDITEARKLSDQITLILNLTK